MHDGQAFVPPDLDATDFRNLAPLFDALMERPIASSSDLERWLLDRSLLAETISEARARLYITMTCNTGDEAAQKAYARFVEDVAPRLTPRFFDLNRRLVAESARTGLTDPRYEVLLRNTRAEVELFREENIPLETQLAKLSQRYDQIAGAMTVHFDGAERTMSQMARYLEEPDRAVREAAWLAAAQRRFRDREAIDTIYDDMIALRDRVARNAGFADYVGYAFKSRYRFDYTPADCERFHAAVEEFIVPLVRHLENQRAAALGVDILRPWDLSVDVRGRPALRPFAGGADLVRRTRAVFRRLDSRLASMFESLGDGTGMVRSPADVGRVCLDLDSRRDKAPGGYQYNLDRIRRPFIFMNAAGMQRDVETIIHEAGHAFHSILCSDEPLLEYREAPTEFAEVASMSMELLTMRHWGPGAGGTFYAREEDFLRACRDHLKRAATILPWIAQIDAFQLWVYRNPRHTRSEREAAWLALDERFGSSASWQGLEEFRATMWHRQPHLFGHPMYYIEYGIAQLGALQLWLHSLECGETSAVERYLRALRLGGSRPLPALFEAAGINFDFGPGTVRRLGERVAMELAKLPE
jgi:oligoendopeptidase F